jgi:hypothetical protein
MNTTHLIIFNSVSLILCAVMLIKLKLKFNKLKKDYDIVFKSTESIEYSRVNAERATYYNQKCHLENLVEAQSEKLKHYQQLLSKD